MTVNINGKYQARIPRVGNTKIKLPQLNKNQRDRSQIQPPSRYTTTLAQCHDEPNSYEEAMASPESDKSLLAMKEKISQNKQHMDFGSPSQSQNDF